MKQFFHCKQCKKKYEWETNSVLYLPKGYSTEPDFCSSECREASENEVDRKTNELPPYELKRLQCNCCGHHQFYRVSGWEKTLAPPLLHFACRNCRTSWWISAGDIYEFDGNHMVVKETCNLGKGSEPLEWKGEYKWTSNWEYFEQNNWFLFRRRS